MGRIRAACRSLAVGGQCQPGTQTIIATAHDLNARRKVLLGRGLAPRRDDPIDLHLVARRSSGVKTWPSMELNDLAAPPRIAHVPAMATLGESGSARMRLPGDWTTMVAPMVTVVLVDDDGRFRRAARRALTAEGLEFVAEAADGVAALAAVSAWAPDVVLVDIGLPEMDGLEVARRLREGGSGATVILMSSRDADYGRRVAAGIAAGFIPKNELSRTSIQAIVGLPPP
jgi:CheY-like chemotaxis protein